MSWRDVLKEFDSPQPPGAKPDADAIRARHIQEVTNITNRPLIVYASDFLKKRFAGAEASLDWYDKEGFAEVLEGLSGNRVDVLVHSPGGLAEAAESLVEMLRSQFRNIRFIVPNIAKSAAAMLVLSGDEILMDEMSELGPIDPQFNVRKADGTTIVVPAQAIRTSSMRSPSRSAQIPVCFLHGFPSLSNTVLRSTSRPRQRSGFPRSWWRNGWLSTCFIMNPIIKRRRPVWPPT